MKNRQKLVLIGAGAVIGASILLIVGASTDNSSEGRLNALDKRVSSLETELGTLKTRMARSHPDRLMEQEAATKFAAINAKVRAGDLDNAKPQLAKWMEDYGNTRAAGQARNLEKELAILGRTAPASWNITRWYQGDASSLGSDTTILVFWETWCPHCRRAMPTLQQTYAKYKSRGLSIVGLTKLTRDSTDQKVTEFMAQHKLMYPMAKEDGTMSTYFNVGGIPSSAVLKNGKVVWSGHPAAINDGMIEGWLSDATS